MERLREARASALFWAVTLLLAGGVAAWLLGAAGIADALWVVATAIGALVAIAWTVAALRERRLGVDVIAVLALLGALATDEYFAGAVIAVMLATGRLLDDRAARRARRDLGLLVERAPRTARRWVGEDLQECDAAAVSVGDRLLVAAGETVPVDGRLIDAAVLDESMLSGEPHPVDREPGQDVRSGAVNAGAPFSMLATADAGSSTYAAIVRLVEEAQASSSPFVRLADRIAVGFVPLTLLLAGLSWWISGSPERAVAVLVVATPCPLLLAAPIAIMSGLSRAARIGVIIKGGGALERLAQGRTVLLDKTGTLTRGRPQVVDVVADPEVASADDLLRWAASLDQVSPHPLAGALVEHARSRGFDLEAPTAVQEVHGYGIEGVVGGRRLRVGKAGWILGEAAAPEWAARVRRRVSLEGALSVAVGIDGRPAGAVLFADPLRPDAARMIRSLREAGFERAVLVSGDRADAAESIGRLVGVDAVHAECDPAEKVEVVRQESLAAPTVMVGDGVNDAPALATAHVGVAVAAQGSTASAQTADVVLTVDRIDRLADAVAISHRSRRIAWESVAVGMGLSLVAMVAAAFGLLPPAVGALLQEVIDVLAVASALRAVRPGSSRTVTVAPADAAVVARLLAEHESVAPLVEEVRHAADALDVDRPDLARVRDVQARLAGDLLPHERAEERELVPIVAKVLGGRDPMGAISRTHAEIEHQVARLGRLLGECGDPPDPQDVIEVRRLLYVLYGVLALHAAQEEEGVFSLVGE